ncbi:vacuolar aminopeptidase 1 [Recurvomyces mirabilis]|nr:vacuolar aminopeptidase 1 [Recurvomyces mirabilis]
MAECAMHSPPNTQPRPAMMPAQQQQPKASVNLNQPTQIVGSDAYTKWLMTRVATGVATPEEQAMWQQHVNMVKSKPTPAPAPASMPPSAPPPPQRYSGAVHDSRAGTQPSVFGIPTLGSSSEAPLVWEPVNPPNIAEMSPHALQDYQMQLILLEQQNRKRNHMPNNEVNEIKSSAPAMKSQQLPSTFVPPSPYAERSFNESARQDYEMQLMLLEQQNKRRLQMTRQYEATQSDLAAGTSSFHQKLAASRTKPAVTAVGGGPFGVVPHHAIAPAALRQQAIRKNAAKYAEPFCKFLTENPTVFHAVDAVKKQLKDAGFKALSERDSWDLETGGSYFVERNGSALIAFSVGSDYKPGNGAAILAGHVDALTAKLKPISQVPNKAGYLQLGVAPYAGAPNTTWWDRDLSIGGRVLVKEGDRIVSKLVKLDWPIARIPTLAPHFGAAAYGPFNPETQMVPIIGLDHTDSHAAPLQTIEPFSSPSLMGGASGGVTGFAATQPPRLVKAIGNALGLRADTYSNIVNWELELYDVQPATLGGLDKEFIFAGRIDDKLCSWAAIQALIETKDEINNSSQIKMVGLFDDEEIGSLLRQGAHGNFLPTVMERAVGSLAGRSPGSDIMGRTYANSFLVSSDVTHAVNPNFLGAYLENHSPHLNVGVVVSADSNGHMTTDAVSTAVLKRCADKVGAQLQVFQIRNDSRSGGTVGPMLSSATGMRSVDAGIPQLSMHSIRATTGALDPGLGVHCFKGFLNGFEAVDKEFRD